MKGRPSARSAGLLAAAGITSAAFAFLAAPTAIADTSNLICSNGEIAMDGTCVPATSMDPVSDSLELPDSRVSDVSGVSPGDFSPSGAPSEAYLSERGYGSQP